MKIMKNHLILFDAQCPMCDMYTKLFIKTGMLDQNGREAYQNFEFSTCPYVDKERAVNEIALLNTVTGEVSYGVKSLFKLIGTSFPWLNPLFHFAPFVYLMTKFYAFISYNRRVIIPSARSSFELQPQFKLLYRITYLLFAWTATATILSMYSNYLTEALPKGSLIREYLICGGQVLFQLPIILLVDKRKLWDYLGNMMTVSLGGAMLLIPVMIAGNVLDLDLYYYLLSFMLVAGLMLIEHIRRLKILDISWTLSASWFLYRVLILLLLID